METDSRGYKRSGRGGEGGGNKWGSYSIDLDPISILLLHTTTKLYLENEKGRSVVVVRLHALATIPSTVRLLEPGRNTVLSQNRSPKILTKSLVPTLASQTCLVFPQQRDGTGGGRRALPGQYIAHWTKDCVLKNCASYSIDNCVYCSRQNFKFYAVHFPLMQYIVIIQGASTTRRLHGLVGNHDHVVLLPFTRSCQSRSTQTQAFPAPERGSGDRSDDQPHGTVTLKTQGVKYLVHQYPQYTSALLPLARYIRQDSAWCSPNTKFRNRVPSKTRVTVCMFGDQSRTSG